MSTITVKTIKTLFAKSGNECAFPGCKEKLIYDDNKIMCDIAHIEARSIGGPRYNAMQTEEERNCVENLICLCSNHHKLIDSYPEKYSVAYLKEIKKNHESICSYKQNFDYEAIFEKNEETILYFNQLLEINRKKYCGPKRIVNVKRNFSKIINDTTKSLNTINNINKELNDFAFEIDAEVHKRLEELKFNSELWDSKYYNLGAEIMEYTCLGIPNCIEEIKINLLHIQLLYYIEFLKLNPNDESAKKQSDKIKKDFKKACKYSYYYD